MKPVNNHKWSIKSCLASFIGNYGNKETIRCCCCLLDNLLFVHLLFRSARPSALGSSGDRVAILRTAIAIRTGVEIFPTFFKNATCVEVNSNRGSF
jgi:hypothetical protein